MPRRIIRPATALAVGALLLSAPAGARQARVITVGSDTALAAAVAALGRSGGTILLRPGTYRRLMVRVKPARRLHIRGTSGVRIERVVFDGAVRVSLGGVVIRPLTRDASIEVWRSWRIDLHDLVVTARGTRFAAGIVLADAHRTTVRRSRFTHCGDRAPQMVNCLTLYRWTSHVTVEDNWFRDCFGCDFINGRFRSHLTIRRNRFDRALPCGMGRFRCGHNDLVQLFGGKSLLVERNRFGIYRLGGAQLYLTNGMDQAVIRNNVFLGTDPGVPRYRARVGLILGSGESRRLPYYARVVNNTFLSGATRTNGYAGSLRMSSRYGSVPRIRRPVLANNVIRLLRTTWPVCAAVRASLRNVVVLGEPCSPDDDLGSVYLDRRGRPTGASTLLIDQASRSQAPPRDFAGGRRRGAPDVGAYEYRGRTSG